MNRSIDNSEYASWRQRSLALCVDFFATMLAVALLLLLWSWLVVDLLERYIIGQWLEGTLVIPPIIAFVLWHRSFRSTGRTLGCKLMKIAVMPAVGVKIGSNAPVFWLISSAPHFAFIFSFPRGPVGQQSLLDQISGTYTVKVKTNQKLFSPNA